MAISSLPNAAYRHHALSLPTQIFITLGSAGQFKARPSQSMSAQFGPGSEFQSEYLYIFATTKSAACRWRGICKFYTSGWKTTSFLT